MLTDDEARRLLQHAGETVTVDPARTVPEPARRPTWPILVAAAAVVAVAVTSVVLANRGGGPDPAPAPSVPQQVQRPTDPAADLGQQLYSFAQGAGDLPPTADQVDLYVGGAFTGFITQDSATDRKAWRTCTETGTYAGRDCPFSPLEVLRDRGRSVAFVDGRGERCLARLDHPDAGIASADSVAIVPTRTPSGCAGQFAVRLYVNDDDELIAVDLLLPRS